MAIPKNGKPVIKHTTLDDGFVQVAKAVRQAAQPFTNTAPAPANRTHVRPHAAATQTNPSPSDPRSGNLSVPKEFTDRERDAFLTGAFEYLARYFENSLKELQSRNEHVETEFRQIDANRFEAAGYVAGREQGRCGIWVSSSQHMGCQGNLLLARRTWRWQQLQ